MYFTVAEDKINLTTPDERILVLVQLMEDETIVVKEIIVTTNNAKIISDAGRSD